MKIHSSILAWKIPWTEEPGGLQSMGSQRVRRNWACMHAHTYKIYICKLVSSQSGHTREPYFRLFYRGNPQQQIERPCFWQVTPLGSHTLCCHLLGSELYPPSVKSRAFKFCFRRRYFSLSPFEAHCTSLKFFFSALNWVNIPGLEFRDLIVTLVTQVSVPSWETNSISLPSLTVQP